MRKLLTITALLAVLFTAGAADVKISSLTPATTLYNSDIFYVVTNGVDRKVTLFYLRSNILYGLVLSSANLPAGLSTSNYVGTFTGDGAGITNITASGLPANLTGTVVQATTDLFAKDVTAARWLNVSNFTFAYQKGGGVAERLALSLTGGSEFLWFGVDAVGEYYMKANAGTWTNNNGIAGAFYGTLFGNFVSTANSTNTGATVIGTNLIQDVSSTINGVTFTNGAITAPGGLTVGTGASALTLYNGADQVIAGFSASNWFGDGLGVTNIQSTNIVGTMANATAAVNATNFWGTLTAAQVTNALPAILTNNISGNATTSTHSTNFWGTLTAAQVTNALPAILTNAINTSGTVAAGTINAATFNVGTLVVTNAPEFLDTSLTNATGQTIAQEIAAALSTVDTLEVTTLNAGTLNVTNAPVFLNTITTNAAGETISWAQQRGASGLTNLAAGTGTGLTSLLTSAVTNALPAILTNNTSGNATTATTATYLSGTRTNWDSSTNGFDGTLTLSKVQYTNCAGLWGGLTLAGPAAPPTSTDRPGVLFIYNSSGSNFVVTTPASWKSSDWGTTRTLTNAQVLVVSLDVYADVMTNAAIAQFK